MQVHAAQWIRDNCVGCHEDGYGDERMWTPAQDCPVHGEHPERFWDDFNHRFPPELLSTPNADAVARIARCVR